MPIYLVGDIQGCFSELQALLKQVSFNAEKDELWLAGDLVARGPDSLATLRFVKALGDSAKVVLGNHDLHLLSIHARLKKAKPLDHLDALLNAPDVDEIMEWLAQQPLLRKIPHENAYMSHAGVSPQWSLEEAQNQAIEAQKRLASTDRIKWLNIMYGEQPNDWKSAITEEDKFRYTINAFTRMRYCFNDKTLEFSFKGAPYEAPSNITPWYMLAEELENNIWFFGHWASLLGHCAIPNAYALDTGCVWGNELTMIRWHDKKVFAEKCHCKISN
jgi:bis(5'-nucleosyl)-tetraphosphatase (symmetrical)